MIKTIKNILIILYSLTISLNTLSNSNLSELNSKLLLFARRNDATNLKKFINKKANINAKDLIGWTPLIWAAYFGNEDLLRFLIDNGARTDVEDNRGETALSKALKGRSVEAVNILKLQEAINNQNNLDSYINNLNSKNLHWFINRAMQNALIYGLISDPYKLVIDIYRDLKSNNTTEEKVVDILEGKASYSKSLNKISKTNVYKQLMLDLTKILAISSPNNSYFDKKKLSDKVISFIKKVLKLEKNQIENFKTPKLIPMFLATKIVLDY